MVAMMREVDDFRSFFGRSLREMTDAEYYGFRKMMKRLRKELNDPDRFDELVGRGVKEIFIRTTTHLEDQCSICHVWNRRKKYDARRAGSANTRRFLELLRKTLNDEVLFNELSLVGPYSFCLPIISDAKLEPGILIRNHVTNCCPNADWSIMETTGAPRLWYHS